MAFQAAVSEFRTVVEREMLLDLSMVFDLGTVFDPDSGSAADVQKRPGTE